MAIRNSLGFPTLDEIGRGDTLSTGAAIYQVPAGHRLCSACLKLLDDVGRDHFISGLRLGGVRGKGCDVVGGGSDVAAHGEGSSVFDGPRQQGRQVQEAGFSPVKRSDSGVERAERRRGLCTSADQRSAEDWGACCARQGRSPSGRLGFLALRGAEKKVFW